VQDAQKKQPPCVDALIRMQVARVVIGELDPDPRHHGRGLAALERSGIDVQVAPEGAVPAGLLAEFRDVLRRDRPYVLLKWAQCLDGRWSSGRPDQPWISSEESRRSVHRLRAHVDAILVGSGTVLGSAARLGCLLTWCDPGLMRRGAATCVTAPLRSGDIGPA